MKNNRPWIVNMFIAKYEFGNIFNHDELRSRELLLHKKESISLATRIKLEGLTLVALCCYFEGSLVKVEIGLARGKKLTDKREAIKERDSKRNQERDYKNSFK
jgi:SsrA-binding protein